MDGQTSHTAHTPTHTITHVHACLQEQVTNKVAPPNTHTHTHNPQIFSSLRRLILIFSGGCAALTFASLAYLCFLPAGDL